MTERKFKAGDRVYLESVSEGTVTHYDSSHPSRVWAIWDDDGKPEWIEERKVVLVSPTTVSEPDPNSPMTPDEIIEVVTAFKEGKEIEFYNGAWCSTLQPAWNFSLGRYRVKPERKPDVIRYARKCDMSTVKLEDSELKLVFDGDTGEFKFAEIA